VNRALLLAALLVACGKKEDPQPTKPTPTPSASASTNPPLAASASERALYRGSYTAKQADVRTPDDAPKFIHPDSKDALGAGELEITVENGVATGKASGALGAQIFSGTLEDGHLRGNLYPSEAGTMWGLLDATVEGAAIKGTVRASGKDGRVVREATFTLEKK
jgi:hypothetical protein